MVPHIPHVPWFATMMMMLSPFFVVVVACGCDTKIKSTHIHNLSPILLLCLTETKRYAVALSVTSNCTIVP
jgi:hypothetical protein